MYRCSPGDIDTVFKIFSDESVLPYITDDGHEDLDFVREYAAHLLARVDVFVLRPSDGNIVIFIPENGITYEVHVASVDGPGRKHAMKDLRDAVIWMMDHGAKKIIAKIPRNNGPARMAAIMCGMEKEGTLKKAWQKGGLLWDMDIFGASPDMKGD